MHAELFFFFILSLIDSDIFTADQPPEDCSGGHGPNLCLKSYTLKIITYLKFQQATRYQCFYYDRAHRRAGNVGGA